MEFVLIIALLVSNVWLIGKLLRKPDTPCPPPAPTPDEKPPAEQRPFSPEDLDDSILGESMLDMSAIEAMIAERVDAKVEQMVERIRTEFTKPEDVGLPPEDETPPNPQVPDDKIDEVFTHHTVGEASDEKPELQEPRTHGHDFKAYEAALRVAKDEPHTPEEAAAAKETLADLHGTVIEETISLDPKVRTKILTIIYGDENETLDKATIAKKKVAFSGTIDTFDVDQLNLNILT